MVSNKHHCAVLREVQRLRKELQFAKQELKHLREVQHKAKTLGLLVQEFSKMYLWP